MHVVNSLAPGGTERMLVELLRSFNTDSVQHSVVTLREPGALASRLPDNVACRPLCIKSRSATAGVQLGLLARRHRTTILHARNTGAWFDATVAKLLSPGTQLVLGYHGSETHKTLTKAQKRKITLAKWSQAKFTSVSESGRVLLQNEASVPNERVDLLRNGIDLTRFSESPEIGRNRIRREFNLEADDFVVGNVGSLTPIKNQRCLLNAVAKAKLKIPRIKLMIAGDGPLRESLARQTRELGLERCVRWVGMRDDIPAILSALDVYACSSLFEGTSCAILEAMASSLPIIATRVGDNALLVEDGTNGILVPPEDSDAMARSVLELFENRSYRHALGEKSRHRAQSFSIARCAQRYEAYYRQLIEIRP